LAGRVTTTINTGDIFEHNGVDDATSGRRMLIDHAGLQPLGAG